MISGKEKLALAEGGIGNKYLGVIKFPSTILALVELAEGYINFSLSGKR